MQRWICSACGKIFRVRKNNWNSAAPKEAMSHVWEHVKRDEYVKFKKQMAQRILDIFGGISAN